MSDQVTSLPTDPTDEQVLVMIQDWIAAQPNREPFHSPGELAALPFALELAAYACEDMVTAENTELLLRAAATVRKLLADCGEKPTQWRAEVRRIHEALVKAWPPWSLIDRRFLTLALCGECGELANLVKKEWRGDTPIANLQEELADIRIYLELVAEASAVDLDRACEGKLPELYRRWPEAKPEGAP